MNRRTFTRIAPSLLALPVFALAAALDAAPARADDAATLSITIKDHKFDPPELHAPADASITIRVKNLNDTPSEFESGDLHFEKIVPVGREAAVHVRPLKPGRYKFFDDFHRATQGVLVVP